MRIWSRLLNVILRDTDGTRDVGDATILRLVREQQDRQFQPWNRTTEKPP